LRHMVIGISKLGAIATTMFTRICIVNAWERGRTYAGLASLNFNVPTARR
jgi:hypothetical protein